MTSDGHLPNKVAFDLAPGAGTEITRKKIVPQLVSLGTEPADAGGDGLKDFTWLLSHEGSFDEDELTARTQGRVNEFALRVRAEGELDGTLYGHVLLPGLPVAVDGPGDWLGGVYYVDRVSPPVGPRPAPASKSACSATPMATTSTQAPAWAA